MAVLIKRDSHLENAHKLQEKWSWLFAAGWLSTYLLFAFIAWLAKGRITLFVAVFFISLITLGIAHFIISAIMNKKYNPDVVRAGIEGEEYAATVFSRLPDTFTVYQDLSVQYEGKTSEVDNIVVGPSGVFVIETKNQNGVIYGKYEDQYWEQLKVGRGGSTYNKSFYNPIKQVGTHVYRVAKMLRSKGIRVNVVGMVFMTNKEAVVNLKGTPEEILLYQSTPDSEKAMLNAIKKGDQELTQAELTKINKILAK